MATTTSRRVVFDTNVLVSAASFPRSVPRRALGNVIRQGTIIGSRETLSEIDQVFLRPRFDRYLNLAGRRLFLALLEQRTELVEVTHSITACRDPKDDKFLELALSGHATHIITGDRDLLDLHPFRGIPILTPAAFLAAAG